MSFKRERTREYYLGDTHVENIFIGEMMVNAPGDYVKVYLFALMYADLGMLTSHGDIAKHLAMKTEDVLKAWSYWEEAGVVKKRFEDPENELRYEVEFLNLKHLLYGKTRAARAREKKSRSALPDGIRDMLANEELKKLYDEIESVTEAPLSSEDIREIMAWVSDFGAAPAVVAYAFRYAVTRRDRGLSAGGKLTNYVGRVVKTWTEKELRTVKAVETHLAEHDSRRYLYKRVMKALGMSRLPGEEEQRIMDTWFDEHALDLETVLAACARTAGISNPNIHYVNTVLTDPKKSSGARRARADASGGGNRIAAVKRHYERAREKAEREAEARLREVCEKLPKIAQMDEEIRRSTIDVSKAMLSDAPNAAGRVKALSADIERLRAERAYLLTENNYRPDYTDVAYACALCRDTGTTKDGGRCACFTEKLAELSRETSVEAKAGIRKATSSDGAS